ncbi:hypothetical protein EJB05_36116, partial [Eragrostis curvula]
MAGRNTFTDGLRGRGREEIVSVGSSDPTLRALRATQLAANVTADGAVHLRTGSRTHTVVPQAPVDDVTQYLPDLMTNVPEGAISESGDIEGPGERLCRHMEPPVCKYCWDGKDTGRYYYGCRRKEKMCKYIDWIDPKWPYPVQVVLLTVWKMIKEA